MEEYDLVDYQTDIDWFIGMGLDEETARDYIKYLLIRKPSKEVIKKFKDEEIIEQL